MYQMYQQEQELATPAELKKPPDAGGKRKSLSPEKENRLDGTKEATDGARSAENGMAPQDASPFATISASMGWDTFHMVCFPQTLPLLCFCAQGHEMCRHLPPHHMLQHTLSKLQCV